MCNLGEGIAEKNKALGMAEGKAIGKAEGMDIINKLYNLLFEKNRFDDAKRAAKEPAYQKKLLAEFELA